MAAFQHAGIQPPQDDVPSPRRRVVKSARRVASSIGLGLERNFESKVSMTPPARLPGNPQNYSPFDVPSRIDFPATEAKRSQLPRSQAFGPFSPLNVGHSFNTADALTASSSSSSLRRTVALQGHMQVNGLSREGSGKRVAGMGRDERLIRGDQLDEVDAASIVAHTNVEKTLADSFAMPSLHSRFRTPAADDQDAKTAGLDSSSPRRRRTATMPVRYRSSDSSSMHREPDVQSSSPPHADVELDGLAGPYNDDSSDAADSSAGSGIDEDDDDVNTLRPGATFSCRRMSGVRSISASHSRQRTAPGSAMMLSGNGGEMMARSATTSSICECGCGSTHHSHQQEQVSIHRASSRPLNSQTTSPFKTPNKRRARIQGSSSSSLRGRTFTTASPVAAPADSEEGSLFGSISSSSMGLEGVDDSDAVHRSFYETKRRSVGSLSHWQESTPLPSHGSSRRGIAAIATGPRRPSVTALSRISSDADQPYDTPGRLTFDDSGVALQSPADNNGQADKQRAERLLTKSLTRSSIKSASEDSCSSPSKLAAARRVASETHGNSSLGEMSTGRSAPTARGRSSLANETHFSDEDSSANTTPEVRRRFASAASVPENLVSPSSLSKHSRSSQSSSSLAADGGTAPYLTPQNYKNVVPLQAAFMSTGLASKRSRPTLANLDPLSGDPLPPLPAKLSFNNIASTPQSYQSSGNMAASLGLRDVVAAANAHAAAAANTSTTSTMPDTPVKRPVASFAGIGAKSGIPIRSRLNMTLSPVSNDGNDSSSGGSMCGGDSPLLSQDCHSPTLALTSIVSTRCRSPMSILEASSRDRSGSSGSPADPMLQMATLAPNRSMTSSVSPTKSIARKRSVVRQSLPNQLRTNEDSLRAQVMARPLSLSRPPLGLQRKSSFGPGSEQAAMLTVHSPLFDTVPSTPTRHSSTIKWYEAAQLMSTPSPSHRRQSYDARRESWQANGSMRGKGSRKNSLAPGSLLLPTAPSARSYRSSRTSYFETRFTVQSVLGVGEFSQVDKVEDKTDGLLYAVKRMKRGYAGSRDRLRRLEEVDILRHLGKDGGHPNIVAFFDAWEEAGHLFIQTELCPCVDFSSFLQHFSNMGGSLDEARLWKVMCELKDGLGYIHDMQVLHLDLKPANIFITEIATLKIGDFGLATRWPPVDAITTLAGAAMGDEDGSGQDGDTSISSLPSARSTSTSLEREGDREYIAPEIIMHGRYSQAADVFSLGLVMLEAAGNVILPDNGEAWQKLRNDDLSDVDLTQFSVSLVQLIRACLASEPGRRPTVEDLHRHPVLRAVAQRVSLGVEKSELDQLPIFDMTTGESNRSLASLHKRGGATVANGDVEMDSGEDLALTEQEDIVPCTPRPFAGPHMGIDNGGNGIAGAMMERTSSGQSALGLEGVEEDDKVLDVRGALIYENLDFLITILEADPDPENRITSSAAAYRSTVSNDVEDDDDDRFDEGHLGSQHHRVPTISIDTDTDDQFDVGAGGSTLRHAPPRASPLRQSSHEEEELDEMDMDVDA